ncbi:hypothetical protein PAQ31011_05166 [Pandoraea aquatica]|uniref:Uncharacterized protein n=1 Tax=Pandoraea aquatica TaxID=2508290 RepID=A0A5E4Z755_9BURK|nr:hypothetical protein [Pandoraea aquatica]VVE56979.1 hypothetical protein PAQ31011_05166 [Pandoraea aquatica]
MTKYLDLALQARVTFALGKCLAITDSSGGDCLNLQAQELAELCGQRAYLAGAGRDCPLQLSDTPCLENAFLWGYELEHHLKRRKLIEQGVAVYQVGAVFGTNWWGNPFQDDERDNKEKWFVSALADSPQEATIGDIPLAETEEEAWQLAEQHFYPAPAVRKGSDEVTRLVKWIDDHYPAEPTIDNGDGTLTVSVLCVPAEGDSFVERSVIPANLKSARDWLGY